MHIHIESGSFDLFGKTFPLYGLCFWIGIILATTLAILLCTKRGMKRYDLIYAAVFAMVGVFIGSKLLFILITLPEIIENDIPLMSVIRGGFVFYGGLGGGALGIFIYAKAFKMKVIDFFDMCAVVVPLGHAAGRVGCLFGGCCYGCPYDGPFSVTYGSTQGTVPLNTPLLPVQLIESMSLLLLFVVILVVFLLRPKQRGLNSCLYLIGYPIIRFTLEFFRYDAERGGFLGLSTSQWISLAIFVGSVTWLVFSLIKKRKGCEDREEQPQENS